VLVVAESSQKRQREKLDEMKFRTREIRQASRPPQTPEEAFETAGMKVAESLSPQLGTDATTLMLGQFDMRRLAIINEQLQAALAYFSWRGGGQYIDSKGNTKTRKGIRFWAHIVNQYLNLSPSIGGVGRRQLIEMQRASAGAPPPMMPPEERPGWIGRHITDRRYKEKWDKEHGY